MIDVIDIIERSPHVRRFLWALVLTLYFPALASLIKAIRWW